MAYITDADFIRAFGEVELADLTHEDNDFARAEKNAAGLIDGYLASRYALPLASTPEMVKGWALDITRYRLWDEAAPEEVRRRYEDALAQLKDVAKGLIALPPDAQGQQPQATGVYFDGYSDERVMTSESLKDFVGC